MGTLARRSQYQKIVFVLGLLGIFVACLLQDGNFQLVEAVENGVCDNESPGECLVNRADIHSSNVENTQKYYLRPSSLPQPKFFDGFHRNTTVAVGNRQLKVTQGSIPQQGRMQGSTPRSNLVVLPELVPRKVVAEILTLLRGNENADIANGQTTIQLDRDPDSVDGMTSQEIFLDNDSLRNGKPSKSDPSEDMAGRTDLRQKLRALTDEFAHEMLAPFLQKWYGLAKCGREGRRCTPCYSLIRRYRAGERQSHAPHYDAHSFVTVVVSLTDYGDEYTGGLYVSTKNSERNYVRLNRGDAVAHQGGK